MIDGFTAFHNLMNSFIQLLVHAVQRSQQTAVITRFQRDFCRQITGSDFTHNRGGISRFTAQLFHQMVRQQQCHRQ
ncbi:hypothetical protein SRABI106_04197 [Rahnella aquatilis]|nr:hypothetical protein SRABI106_04197 [Rahnella aquatilis]